MASKATRSNVEGLGHQLVMQCFGQGARPFGLSLVGGFKQEKHVVKHSLAPGLLFLLHDKQAIPQQMRPTQAVGARMLIRTGPSVMHDTPRKVRQKTDGISRLLSSCAMPVIQSQKGSRRDMHPIQDAFDPHSRFVRRKQITLQHERFDLFLRELQSACRLLNPIDQGPFRTLAVAQIRQGFTHPLHGQQWEPGQRDCQRLQPRAIVRSRSHLFRNVSPRPRLTSGAAYSHRLVLFHFQPQFRQIVDLTPLFDLPLDRFQIVLAGLTEIWTMLNTSVGLGNVHQRLAGMAFLIS